jgi:hypothetical protein
MYLNVYIKCSFFPLIWDSDSSIYWDYVLLDCDAMYMADRVQCCAGKQCSIFLQNISHKIKEATGLYNRTATDW